MKEEGKGMRDEGKGENEEGGEGLMSKGTQNFRKRFFA